MATERAVPHVGDDLEPDDRRTKAGSSGDSGGACVR